MEFTTNGSVDHTQSLEPRQLPPGAPGKPYVISSQDGEIIYIPLSKSATRLLVTGKESENAFAMVASGGSQSDPIGFHYHREAHDVFLCLAGEVNVWAGDQCRIMTSGDFASVPPGTIHQYQVLGPHSEFAGLIVPGGWEEFFRFIGEPYSGPMWPMQDERNFFEVLLPRLKQAAEQFDMVPCPQHKQFEPQAWQSGDNRLPGIPEPYFLKNATGPAYEVGGTVSRPLVTTAESYGKFAIGSIEASCQHQEASIFAGKEKSIRFDAVHHAFMVTQGAVEFHLESHTSSNLSAGDVIYVPKGTNFRFSTMSRFSKMYAFANGGGVVELLSRLGQKHSLPILSDNVSKVDHEVLVKLQQDHGCTLV
ncbi:hypothetical protein LTR78_008492 [Recurvomyces mirabilis]|uniref:Cupin type-2 domain-containing protein n=1 Tax=Recurvomyces mirabilis TaxID=574656 RepID=A0AAE0TPU9_9PEZI|nr:hypothetical protein LTR78_008492 [Recurvomyces mirabilis]KAK5156244.1 hypothetical protein LTS14_005131 [Recurvomyces mirabilis]